MSKKAITTLSPLLGLAITSPAAVHHSSDFSVTLNGATGTVDNVWSIDGHASTKATLSRSIISSAQNQAKANVFVANDTEGEANVSFLFFGTLSTDFKAKIIGTGYHIKATSRGLTQSIQFSPYFGGISAVSHPPINLKDLGSKALSSAFPNPEASGGMIGFQFFISEGQFAAGWANVSWSSSNDSMSLSFTNVTYSDTGSILAGTDTETIPEPESVALGLGALALGAAGLTRWRKRKQAA